MTLVIPNKDSFPQEVGRECPAHLPAHQPGYSACISSYTEAQNI